MKDQRITFATISRVGVESRRRRQEKRSHATTVHENEPGTHEHAAFVEREFVAKELTNSRQ